MSNGTPARIGLALSGGGFRASVYHLGTIRYLEQTGIMPRVEVMSTVSGGSIIGAYYLVEMERKLRPNPDRDRLQACDEIIAKFCEKLDLNFHMRALVFYPFFHPVLTLLALLRLRHSGDTMAAVFERHLFAPELRLGDLPVQICRPPSVEAPGTSPPAAQHLKVQGTRILINTTSVITGKRVVYSRENESGLSSQFEKSNPNNISLARAVGASGAVPGLFKPLRLGNEVLADGGVVDNQGIESLLDYFQITDEKLNALPDAMIQPPALRTRLAQGEEGPRGAVFLIVSDGAGQFMVKNGVDATRRASAGRSMEILQSSNRGKVLKLLLETRSSTRTPGFRFAFTHLAMNLKGIETDAGKRLPSEFIGPTAEMRTDLDEFSRLERDVLMYHGYTLMKNQVTSYGGDLVESGENRPPTAPGSGPDAKASENFCWPPPFVELVNPQNGNERRSENARREIKTFLGVGRSAVFRDLRRFKRIFIPLLAGFLVLGCTFGHFLLNLGLSRGLTLRELIRDKVAAAVQGLLPDWNILGLIDLGAISDGFETGGAFYGTIDFLSGFLCWAIGLYVALWLYWMTKRRLELPRRFEERMMVDLGRVQGGAAETGDDWGTFPPT